MRKATAADVDALMRWFPERDDVLVWGGPDFRYPFTRDSFFADIGWDRMPTFCLLDVAGEFVGFGQVYDRGGRIHFARLVVRPDRRGEGIGKRLIRALMEAGAALFPGDECSLFVLRDNRPAYECYRSLGFTVADYPQDTPYADVCDYLVRPLRREEN